MIGGDKMAMVYDVIAIGKGPAAISAALYIARSNYKTLLIGGDSLLIKTDKIDNYYGFPNGITGLELLKAGEEQAKKFGTEIIEEEVVSVELNDDGKTYKIITTTNSYITKAVLFATGQQRNKIAVKDLEKFEGSGVSYCVICDGFFFKNKKVGLMGFSDYMVHEALELKTFTQNVTVYTNGKQISEENMKKIADLGFNINTNTIVAVSGENRIEKVVFKDETTDDVEGLFIAYGTASSVDFARKLGITINEGSISVDKNGFTGVKGIYAAGDCTGGLKQIATAVGEGAAAGVEIINYLRK